MSSEEPRDEPAELEGMPAEGERAEAPAQALRGASAEDDPLVSEGEEAPLGLLARLNPLRVFRRRSVEGLVEEGKDLLDNGSLAQALVAFHKALKLDPNCTPAYRGMGKVYYKRGGRGNLEKALKHYQEAIRRNPKEHDLYAITAKIYDSLGKRKEATLERKKFVIVRALEADARNPVANNNMGILFLQQGRMDEALDYFNRAINADRRYDVAYRNLAAAYFQIAKQSMDADKKLSSIGKAREAINKAMEIAPTVSTLMAHARLQMMDGNLEEVLNVLERVDQMDPANAEVYFMKKMALEGLGRFEEAKTAHESYLVFKRQATGGAEEAPAAGE